MIDRRRTTSLDATNVGLSCLVKTGSKADGAVCKSGNDQGFESVLLMRPQGHGPQFRSSSGDAIPGNCFNAVCVVLALSYRS